jgi:hypothetical protein
MSQRDRSWWVEKCAGALFIAATARWWTGSMSGFNTLICLADMIVAGIYLWFANNSRFLDFVGAMRTLRYIYG